MEQKDIRFRKQRDLGVVISDSFDFLKQEAKPIFRMIGIYVLPFVILYAGAQVYFQRNVLSQFDLTNPESLMADIGPFYLNLFMFVFFGLFVQSLLVGTYYSYLEAYIKHGKGNFQLTDISSKFFANSLLALGANLIFVIIVFFGAMMCLLPGLYFANTFSLVVFILIFEKRGISDALSRSWKLVNSSWWNTLLINLVAIIIVYAVGIVLSIPSMIMGVSSSILSTEITNPADYPNWYWVLNAISSVITTVLLVIPFTFQAFQYFNLAERNDPTTPLTPLQ
ncbi:hypothetical protein SAMN05444285_12329 [Draconibacterium orientale]|jgi:hypothetical protein|uniref:DUF7847 domain-containing protein n=2 Tax=Draconibacterium orientale TaxID=1168034 RepID=X5E687_9BACT|nr:hypothetical protein FH5T_16365 [Draconibacterium orientale]SET78186.1 hypothetical protein SAMN05444285_12329 [Draconibacterium orientale]